VVDRVRAADRPGTDTPVEPEFVVAPGLPVPGDDIADERASLNTMLVCLVEAGGSDLHLTVGAPPTIRVNGSLRHLPDYEPMGRAETELMVRAAANADQWDRFERHHEVDFAYSVERIARFRVNLYTQRGAHAAAFRAIPHLIRPLHELDIPESVGRLAQLPRGLVLVTGPTGSGKTTTLASLIDLANQTRSGHIVTIEDPIEFMHGHKKCLVNQREVGADTATFSTALKHALRQDPDIILVGELRDLETTQTALTAAETGHLVLASLHTQSAAQTVERIIDIFPPHQQTQIRTQLASAIQGVLAQALVPRADGKGRTVITEIMYGTPAIRNLIREGKSHQIPSFIQSGAAEGMLTFDKHLAIRVAERVITTEQAFALCHSAEDLTRLIGRG
jgi:twitching motility protein PilT